MLDCWNAGMLECWNAGVGSGLLQVGFDPLLEGSPFAGSCVALRENPFCGFVGLTVSAKKKRAALGAALDLL
jgi:hypothetical protein